MWPFEDETRDANRDGAAHSKPLMGGLGGIEILTNAENESGNKLIGHG